METNFLKDDIHSRILQPHGNEVVCLYPVKETIKCSNEILQMFFYRYDYAYYPFQPFQIHY